MKQLFFSLLACCLFSSCGANDSHVSDNRIGEIKSSREEVLKEHPELRKLLETKSEVTNANNDKFVQNKSSMKEATFGAGCFWCIEACFKDLEGVVSVKPGYAGGEVKNPTYEQVCSGKTGHAEVARVVYDETKITYDELLEMFWFVHDPTQLNRQGNDIGTQYRSVVFYHDEEQKSIAEAYKQRLTENEVWDKPIVTEIVAINNYYEAEQYHHNYFELNPGNAYCQSVVRPKVEKFKKVFEERLRK